MQQSPLSINTKPRYVKDWSAAKQFLTDLNPTIAVVAIDNHNDFNLILEAQQAAPNTKIVARYIDKVHDGSMHLKPQTTTDKYIVSPLNQLDRIRAYGKNGLTAYFGNEPTTEASPDDLQRLTDHTCEAMDLAANRDFDMSLTVCNFGVGHPKPIDGFLPVWMHPILLKLNEHRNRHYYGLHTYLPADVTEHLNALKKTCTERLFIPLPRIIITETGYDSVGDSERNGFKSRNISNEVFAHRCVSLCNEDLKAWIASGDLLGVAVFMYGDDVSWFSFNVETSSKPGEVSTAWRDTVFKAYRAGELDMHVKDIVLNQPYRLSMPGKIITAYVAPSLTDRVLGTIPDAAKIQLLGRVTISGETWLKISYQAFSGVCWIKGDLISLKQTIETPIIQANIDTKPLQETSSAPQNGETAPAPVTTPKPVESPQNGATAYVSKSTSLLDCLKAIRAELDKAIELMEKQEPVKA